MRQRGFTLVEVLVAAAIAAMMAAVLVVAVPMAARPAGARAAAMQFDSRLAYARALASASGNGATVVLGPAPGGAVMTVYSGRPTGPGALRAAGVPAAALAAQISEAALGKPPFAIFLDGAGHASAAAGSVDASTVLVSDPGCPAGETAIVVTLGDARSRFPRRLACLQAAAGAP